VQFFNLSLLTSDLYAALARILFFGSFTKRSGVAFAVSCSLVATGLVLYFTTPETQARLDDANWSADVRGGPTTLETQAEVETTSLGDSPCVDDRQALLQSRVHQHGQETAAKDAEALGRVV
jgi:hypothetical protein